MADNTRTRAHEALEYRLSTPPAPGVPTPVAPGVFLLRMPLPFALDHINLWLLEDDGGWAVIDTGLSNAAIRELWDALHADCLSDQPLRRIVVTHFHPDHIGLSLWLAERYHSRVWMTAPEYEMAGQAISAGDEVSRTLRLAFLRRHGLDGEQLQSLAGWGDMYRRHVYGLPADFEVIEDGRILTIGANEWRVITGQGHSPDHAMLYCASLGVLISGDQVLPAITPHIGVWHYEPDANPVRTYLDSLRRLAPLPPHTLVLPAHGLPFTGLPLRLDTLAGHHERHFVNLLDACGQPRSAAQLLDVLFRRQLDGQQLQFAMSEAVAHLNYLQFAGNLTRSLDDDDIYRYRRCG